MVNVRATNGVSWQADYTITATDDTAGEIKFVFPNANRSYTGIFQIVNASGAVQAIDIVVDDTVAGEITIADGATYALTATDVVKAIFNEKNA